MSPSPTRREDCFVTAEANVTLRAIVRAAGGAGAQTVRLERLAGQPEHVPTPPPDWQPLAQAAQTVVAAGIARRPFQCAQCGKEHPYTMVLCPQGGPILRGIPLNSCVLFKDAAYLALTDQFAYELADGGRLIARDGMLYDWRDDRWNSLHQVEPYEEVGDGVYALFHRL